MKRPKEWISRLGAVGVCSGLALGCSALDEASDDPASAEEVMCGASEYSYEGRCVIACPTLNGSLCELDGTPIRLPPAPAVTPGGGDEPTECVGDGCVGGLRAVALGLSHSCVLDELGEVACFGSNEYGQLGGSEDGAPIPGLSAVDLAAGSDHTCALLSEGGVHCWGRNDKGQLGDGTEENRFAPVAALGVEDAVGISLAGDVSYVRLRSGQVLYFGVSWGDARFWVTTAAPNGLSDAVSISAGRVNSCARIADGSIRCSGDHDGAAGGSSPQMPLLLDESAVLDGVAVACSGAQACVALRATGQVISWGFQRNGVTGRGAFNDEKLPPGDLGLSDVVGLVAGFEHACALGAGGEVWCWGRDRRGELGGNGDQASPLLLATIEGARRIWSSAGAASTCVELEDRTVQCWGQAESGQLGAGPLEHVTVPGE